MTTPPNKSTTRVPKHPAARVLDGEAEKIKTEKNGMRERMDHTDSIVHLVQGGAGNQVMYRTYDKFLLS